MLAPAMQFMLQALSATRQLTPPPCCSAAGAAVGCSCRNQTLAWGGGGLLVLYLANGLINQIDRLPLLPAFLQLVGFAFSSWFAFR